MPSKKIIKKEKVRELADIARLELNEVETENYYQQINSILKHLESLQKINLSDPGILGLEADFFNKTREDRDFLWPQDEIEIALKQAPEKEDEQIKISRVL